MSDRGDVASGAPGGPLAGDVIAGKYRVERVLGVGGMATVYAATHLELREQVALKLLKPEMAARASVVQRFVREARAAVRIKSEHVARVLDVGTLPDGAPFMVMEMLAGHDLRREVASRGPLPVAEAVQFVIQACDALGEAHGLGIVHRDLKPGNLFLARRADGSALVKVLDFGISKMTDEADGNLTATTDVLGSPLYMSPEQIRSPKDVDPRSDIWSLGAVLYKLLTGKAAFAADTASASLAMIIAEPPPDLRSRRPEVDPELEAVILRCLEKDPRRRPQHVDDLVRGLLPFAPGAQEAGTGSVSRARGRLLHEASIPGAALAGRPSAPVPWALVAAGVVTVAALVVGVGVVSMRAPPAPVPASSAPTPSASASAPSPAASAPASAAPEPPPSASAAPSAPPLPRPSASASAPRAARPGPPPKGATPSHAFDDRQ